MGCKCACEGEWRVGTWRADGNARREERAGLRRSRRWKVHGSRETRSGVRGHTGSDQRGQGATSRYGDAALGDVLRVGVELCEQLFDREDLRFVGLEDDRVAGMALAAKGEGYVGTDGRVGCVSDHELRLATRHEPPPNPF